MSIGFRAASTGDVHLPGATATITKPTGTVSTDVLVVFFGSGTSAGGANAVTAPSGWTVISTGFSATGTGGIVTIYGFWALGSVTNLGFTNSQTSNLDQGWACGAFTGCNTTTPIDATGTTNSNTATASLTTNAVTVATANAWHCIGFADWNSGAFTATSFTVSENAHTNESAGILYNTTPKSTGSTGTVLVTSSAAAASQILLAMPFALRPSTSTAYWGTEAYWPHAIVRPRPAIWTPTTDVWPNLYTISGTGLFPNTGANIATGTTAWSNPGNITLTDAVYATCNTAADTQLLRGTGYGFSIPAGQFIFGIQAQVIRHRLVGTAFGTETIWLVLSSAPAGTAKVWGGAPPSGADAAITLGTSSDLWGTAWTYANINDATFGAQFNATNTGSSGTLSVDSIAITVWYGSLSVFPNTFYLDSQTRSPMTVTPY